jgi:hypothetical protein
MPRTALAYWIGRLIEKRIDFEGPFDRFGERVVRSETQTGFSSS